MPQKKVKHDCYKQDYLFIFDWQECHTPRKLVTKRRTRETHPTADAE